MNTSLFPLDHEQAQKIISRLNRAGYLKDYEFHLAERDELNLKVNRAGVEFFTGLKNLCDAASPALAGAVGRVPRENLESLLDAPNVSGELERLEKIFQPPFSAEEQRAFRAIALMCAGLMDKSGKADCKIHWQEPDPE